MAAIALALICTTSIIILSLPVTVSVNLQYADGQSSFEIAVMMLGMTLFQRKPRLPRIVDHGLRQVDGPNAFHGNVEQMYVQIKKASTSAIPLLGKSTLHEMYWISEGGTGEVISTGMASGGAWVLKSSLTGMLHGLFRQGSEPYILVKPSFEKKFFRSEFGCMASIRLGKSVIPLIRLMRVRTELRKAMI